MATTTTTTTATTNIVSAPAVAPKVQIQPGFRSVSTSSSLPGNKRAVRSMSHDAANSPPLESYYYARTFKSKSTSLSLQIQRIHKSLHPEPVFNITQQPASSRRRLRRAASSANGNATTISVPNQDSELIYDGTHAPITRDDKSVYVAYHYDSPTSEREVAQFSKHGVYFLPSSTPILQPDSPVKASRAASYHGRHTHSPEFRRNSMYGTSSTSLTAGRDVFYNQPVTWILVPSGSGYKVVDQSTNLTIGKWTSKRLQGSSNAMRSLAAPTTSNKNAFTKPSEQQWFFVCKAEVLAVLNNGQLKIIKAAEHPYVDDAARKLRKKYKRKNSIAEQSRERRNSSSSSHSSLAGGAVTEPSSPTKTSKFRSALKRHSSTTCVQTVNTTQQHTASSYRARFVDGIMYTSLSLLLTLDGDQSPPSASSSPPLQQQSVKENVEEEVNASAIEPKRRRRSSIVVGFKKVFGKKS